MIRCSGTFLQLHDRLVRQWAHSVETGHGRKIRPRADVNEDSLAVQDVGVHLNSARSDKTGVATIKMEIRALLDSALKTGAKAQNDGILARDDGGQIYRDVVCFHTPARSVASVMRDLRRRDHGFCGRAAGVYAGSAQMGLFDHGHGPARGLPTHRPNGLPPWPDPITIASNLMKGPSCLLRRRVCLPLGASRPRFDTADVLVRRGGKELCPVHPGLW